MLNYKNVYCVIWILVICLYSLGWSSLNSALVLPLLVFMIVTIGLAFLLGFTSKPLVPQSLIYRKRIWPTILIVLGFFADFIYRGSIPMFEVYEGFDPDAEEALSVGIPVVHVLVIAFCIYYAMYLSYLIVMSNKKQYVFEYLTLLIMLLLNGSRGYIGFCILFLVIVYVNYKTSKKNFHIPLSMIFVALVACAALIIFISVMGNMRYGYKWNDYTYISRIGYFSNYPEWLPKIFMWTYLYVTSPLSNLNLNISNLNHITDLYAYVSSYWPDMVSKYFYHGPEIPAPLYQVSYLNASTGFLPFYSSLGVIGMYGMVVFQFIVYSVVRLFLNSVKMPIFFAENIFSFLVIITIFYNPFSATAVCYILFFLIIHVLILKYKRERGELLVGCQLPDTCEDTNVLRYGLV